MEDDLAAELQDIVSNSEIGDDLHQIRQPIVKQNIQFVSDNSENGPKTKIQEQFSFYRTKSKLGDRSAIGAEINKL